MSTYRRDIKKVGIIGSGTMGRGICLVFAQSGYQVTMVDLNMDILSAAMGQIKMLLQVFVNEKILKAEEVEPILSRITPCIDYQELKDVDYVLEAASESLDVKKQVFTQAEKYTASDVILASNTSGISITSLSKCLQNPARMAGMHWWNPAFISPVVELIGGEQGDPQALDITRELVLKLNRIPVLVKKDIPGFLGNRMQYALMREAVYLYENDVASAEDIDLVVKAGFAFKYPVLGPLETLDLAGMDIFYNVSKYLFADLDASQQPSDFIKGRVDEGKLGIKSKQGFYDYNEVDVGKLTGARTKKMIALLKSQGYLKEVE